CSRVLSEVEPNRRQKTQRVHSGRRHLSRFFQQLRRFLKTLQVAEAIRHAFDGKLNEERGTCFACKPERFFFSIECLEIPSLIGERRRHRIQGLNQAWFVEGLFLKVESALIKR